MQMFLTLTLNQIRWFKGHFHNLVFLTIAKPAHKWKSEAFVPPLRWLFFSLRSSHNFTNIVQLIFTFATEHFSLTAVLQCCGCLPGHYSVFAKVLWVFARGPNENSESFMLKISIFK